MTLLEYMFVMLMIIFGLAIGLGISFLAGIGKNDTDECTRLGCYIGYATAIFITGSMILVFMKSR